MQIFVSSRGALVLQWSSRTRWDKGGLKYGFYYSFLVFLFFSGETAKRVLYIDWESVSQEAGWGFVSCYFKLFLT